MFKEPRPLLVESYSNNFADNQLIDSLNLVEIMSSYNISYEKRETSKSGMYYAKDYIDKYFPGKSTFDIIAVANENYQNISVNRVFGQTLLSYFQSYDYVKPSDALKSFIKGPTITECANTIQISVYHLIYNLIGEEKFDIVKYSKLIGKTDKILIVRDWSQEQYKKKYGKYPVGNFDQKMAEYSGIPSELEISRPTVKIVIMHLFDRSSFKQFLDVVHILHDNKIKIIILSPLNIEQFKQMLKKFFF